MTENKRLLVALVVPAAMLLFAFGAQSIGNSPTETPASEVSKANIAFAAKLDALGTSSP